MDSHNEQKKLALLTSIELVLMRRGNIDYNKVLAKLGSKYNCTIMDCFDHPEYLGDVLKEVYGKKYSDVLDEIIIHLDELASDPLIKNFLKIMIGGLASDS